MCLFPVKKLFFLFQNLQEEENMYTSHISVLYQLALFETFVLIRRNTYWRTEQNDFPYVTF